MKPRRKIVFRSTLTLVSLSGLIFVHSGAAENSTVTFAKDVAAIFYKNCAECHRPGEAAPFSVLTYKEARPWAKSIREKVADRTMPPWHADPHVGEWANDRRLTQMEIDTIIAWVGQGAKEGEAKDLPPQPKFTDGWNMGAGRRQKDPCRVADHPAGSLLKSCRQRAERPFERRADFC
jgi:hypothetical protein